MLPKVIGPEEASKIKEAILKQKEKEMVIKNEREIQRAIQRAIQRCSKLIDKFNKAVNVTDSDYIDLKFRENRYNKVDETCAKNHIVNSGYKLHNQYVTEKEIYDEYSDTPYSYDPDIIGYNHLIFINKELYKKPKLSEYIGSLDSFIKFFGLE